MFAGGNPRNFYAPHRFATLPLEARTATPRQRAHQNEQSSNSETDQISLFIIANGQLAESIAILHW
jgi:hypothetical protein